MTISQVRKVTKLGETERSAIAFDDGFKYVGKQVWPELARSKGENAHLLRACCCTATSPKIYRPLLYGMSALV